MLESVFRNLEWDKFGINIDRRISHLRFADDLDITENAGAFQHMLQQLIEASEIVGLTMNKSKTKMMTNK